MSYDVRLYKVVEGEKEEVFESNYTSNVRQMFRDGLGCPIQDLSGPVADAIPLLESAIADMDARPEHYAALNPENKWGSAEGAQKFLSELLEAAKTGEGTHFAVYA